MLAPWSYRRAYVIDLQCHSSKICLYCVLRTCVDVGEILVEPGQKLMIRSMLLWKGFTHPFAHLLKDNLNLLKIHLYLHLGINKFLHASLSQ
ncbi:unnamed protein product [Brassica napus]|uniref:(rape) hypothetical protein n=1 Tax=Brassica napus TaxID=3708 RepID=A0A816LV42_BRANA|nr:unnamed protein product [Brassica napus]